MFHLKNHYLLQDVKHLEEIYEGYIEIRDNTFMTTLGLVGAVFRFDIE